MKSNALRLNEISCTDLLQMALLTFTRLVINRAHNINIHPNDTTPLLGSQAFHGWCKRILSTEDITLFTSLQTNAMPQASIRPETDPSKEKKSDVQYAVG